MKQNSPKMLYNIEHSQTILNYKIFVGLSIAKKRLQILRRCKNICSKLIHFNLNNMQTYNHYVIICSIPFYLILL